MKRLIALAILLLATPAFAYDLHNLSPKDVLIIGEALDAMPHGKVAELYNRIQLQLSAEDKAAAADRAKTEKELGKIESEEHSP